MNRQLEIPFEEYEDKQLEIPFAEELLKTLNENPRWVEFKFKMGHKMVEVYVWGKLKYNITREEYIRLTKDQIKMHTDNWSVG